MNIYILDYNDYNLFFNLNFMNPFKKFFPSASFLVMILCFFMPFFVVKCQGQVITQPTWLNYLWIWKAGNQSWELWMWKDSKSDVSSHIKFNVYVFLIFISLLVAFGVSVMRVLPNKDLANKFDENWYNKIFLWASLACFILLIIFLIDANVNSSIPAEVKDKLSISFWTGLWLIIILTVINCLYFWNELKLFDKLLKKWETNQ